ncbi:MAG: FecR family protein [Acidobacteriota bacterium]
MSDIYNGPRPLENDSPSGDETVARLLQFAGHRPTIPAADAATVKAAARAEWQSLVWTQRRRKLYLVRGVGGFLAAAAALLLAFNTHFVDRVRRSVTPAAAQVITASGAVDWTVGHELWPGGVVKTGPPESHSEPRIALRLADGASARLHAETRLSVHSASALELESGTIYIDSDGTNVEIRTPLGTITNIGTRFEVHLVPDATRLRVRVRKGKVQLKDPQGVPYVATAGQQLTADGETEPQLDVITTCGSTWDWLSLIRAPFTGTTTFEILEWTAAEAGWELRFKGNAAAQAREANLSEEEFEPFPKLEDNLTWVPAAGLNYHREGCRLTVEPAQ